MSEIEFYTADDAADAIRGLDIGYLWSDEIAGPQYKASRSKHGRRFRPVKRDRRSWKWLLKNVRGWAG